MFRSSLLGSTILRAPDDGAASGAPADSDLATGNDGTIDAVASALRSKREARVAAATPSTPLQRSTVRSDDQRTETPAPGARASDLPTDQPDRGQQTGPDGEEIPAPDDAGEDPSVDAPAGWTAEDRAWFQSLPLERQAIVAKREREFRANESRRHNEHAEHLRAVEAEKVAAQTERQHLSQALQTYAHPLLADFEREFPDLIAGQTNALKIQGEDPLRFQRLQAFQQEFGRLRAANDAIAQRAVQDSERAQHEFRAAENAKLIEAVPEFRDPKKRDVFDREITAHLRNSGFRDEEIMRADARYLLQARKAMLYDKAQEARKAAEQAAKTTNGTPAPRVMRPGAGGQGPGAAGDALAKARQAVQANPGDEAAIVAFMQAKRAAAGRADTRR